MHMSTYTGTSTRVPACIYKHTQGHPWFEASTGAGALGVSSAHDSNGKISGYFSGFLDRAKLTTGREIASRRRSKKIQKVKKFSLFGFSGLYEFSGLFDFLGLFEFSGRFRLFVFLVTFRLFGTFRLFVFLVTFRLFGTFRLFDFLFFWSLFDFSGLFDVSTFRFSSYFSTLFGTFRLFVFLVTFRLFDFSRFFGHSVHSRWRSQRSSSLCFLELGLQLRACQAEPTFWRPAT